MGDTESNGFKIKIFYKNLQPIIRVIVNRKRKKHSDMERKITLSEVQEAVNEAYEKYKSVNDGSVDPRVASTSKPGTFGISVVLSDGRNVDKGDADALFPLGPIAKIPLSVVLLSQNTPDQLIGKAHNCSDAGACGCKNESREKKPKLPLGRHAIRAVSAVIPQGDPEGKFNVISNAVVNLSNSEPSFSDALYKLFQEEVASMDIVNLYKNSDYKLYDDVAQSIDAYIRLQSLELSSRQLATMGATIAADGRNPYTGEYVFDGKIAAPVVAMMATHGKHFVKPWLVATGMPAKKSFTGGIVAILPGFGAIAAYAPEVNDRGVSIKAAGAVAYIAQKLGLNVFASARVEVEK